MRNILHHSSIVGLMAITVMANANNTTMEMVPISTVTNGNNAAAGSKALSVINEQRANCGLGKLHYDPNLFDVVFRHANYLEHIQSRAAGVPMDLHGENVVKGYESLTGKNNPYFAGEDFTARVIARRYMNAGNGGSENVIQEVVFNRDGNVLSPVSEGEFFGNVLLSAPYHMQTLVATNRNLAAASFITYTPYNVDKNAQKGYSMVLATSATKSAAEKPFKEIFTYPCEGTKNTVTALYEELPSPVKGTGRDLQTDPVGQPIYIDVPTANSIKINNVSVYDVKRKMNIPTQLIDYDNDPHKKTKYEMPKNKVFILPLTDSIIGCPNRAIKKCGLNQHTQYRVSFDISINGEKPFNHSFKFTTGYAN
ncbi:MAG: CAP domain-containing protein [Pseudomonadota bacterium]|nr:CAP domain-containing protein [Pseudomonadota bacterium]